MKRESIKDSPYKPRPVTILDYHGETSDSFTIRLDWKIRHDPGQFIFCSIPGVGEAPISICSYSEDYVELNIREVGNVTNALAGRKKGSRLLVRGPYGKPYPIGHFKGKNLIVVGGGSGVDPLKGLIEYVEKHRDEFNDIHLLFGFRSPDDALFRDKLDAWRSKFSVHVTFDKVEKKTSGERVGFVTDLVSEQIHDNLKKVAFVCGPPVMIDKASTILLNKGFGEDQIYVGVERLMYCGIGKCGRCMIHGKYTCLDGAVFKYDELKGFKDD